MPWNDFLVDERFTTLPSPKQRLVANDFFHDTFESDPRYKELTGEQKFKVQSKFYGTIGQQPDSISGTGRKPDAIINPIKRGGSLVARGFLQHIPAGLSTLVRKEDWPLINQKDMEDASQWWKERFDELDKRIPRATGKYTHAPTGALEALNPIRIYNTLAENVPLMAGLGAIYAANPALGIATIGLLEGGNVKSEILEYEKKTGERVGPVVRRGAPILVGALNAALEKTGLDTMLYPSGKRSLMRALIVSMVEGGTETAQDITSILATTNIKPQNRAQIIERLKQSFYAGVILGFGGGTIFNGEENAADPIPLEEAMERTPNTFALTGMLPQITIGQEGEAQQFVGDTQITPLSYPDGWKDPPGDPPDLNETIEIDDTFFEGVPEDTSEDTVIPSWRVTPLVAKAYKKLKRVETGVAAAHARGLDTTKGEASKDQALADFVGSWIDANPDDTEFTGMHSMMSYFKNDAHEAWKRHAEVLTNKRNNQREESPATMEEVQLATPTAEEAADGVMPLKIGGKITTIAYVDESLKPISNSNTSMALSRVATALRHVFSFDSAMLSGIQEIYIFNTEEANKMLAARYPKKTLEEIEKLEASFNGTTMRIEYYERKGNNTQTAVKDIAHELSHHTDWSLGTIAERETLIKEQELPYLEQPGEVRAREREALFERGASGDMHGTSPHLVFQVRAGETQGTSPTPDQVARLLSPLKTNGIFNNITRSPSQLYRTVFDEETNSFIQEPVNAMVDPETGALYLSPGVEMNTIGHEGAEVIIGMLGAENALIKQGLDMFGGDKEALSDAIGEYYAGTQLSPTIMQKLGQWLRLLYAEFKATVGLDQTQGDIVSRINARMLEGREGAFTGRGNLNMQFQRETQVAARERMTRAQLKIIQDKIKNPATRESEKPSLKSKEISIQKILDEGKFEYQAKKCPNSVKYEKLNLTPAEQMLIERVMVDHVKNKTTWTEVDKQAEKYLKNLNRMTALVAKAKKGLALNAAELTAFGMVAQQATSGMVDMVINPQASESNVQASLENYENIISSFDRAKHTAGASLGVLRRMLDRALGLGLQKLERDLRPEELEALQGVNRGDPMAVKRFLASIQTPKWSDYFYSFYYNSILSGPTTHLVNFANNALWAGFQVPHRALVSGLDQAYSGYTGKTQEYFLGEIIPFLGGAKAGFGKGATTAMQVATTGEAPLRADTKAEIEMEAASRAFERSPSAVLRKMAPYISFPTRALRAADVFANTIAYEAQIRALAYRKAMQTPAVLKGLTIEEYIEKTAANPTPEMMRSAADFARYTTFTDRAEEITLAVMKTRRNIPGARIVVPFINTVSNILKRGVEMTPGVGLAYEAINRGGERKGQPNVEVAAKQIEGLVLAFLLLGMVDDDKLTGEVPRDPARRDAFYREGKIPWAVKLGSTWFSYRRMEPFNTVLGSVAVTANRIKGAKDEDISDILIGVGHAVGINLMESTYTENIVNLLEEKGLTRTIQRFPSSLVPYSGFWRSMNKAVEVLGEGDAKVYQNIGFTSALASTIPWPLNTPLKGPVKTNVWGEEIALPGGTFRQWLPFKWSEAGTDRVESELASLEVYPGAPSRTLTIGGRPYPMSEDFYRQYSMSYGAAGKKALDRLVRGRGYQRLSRPAKRKAINRTLQKARSRIRSQAQRRMAQHLRGVRRTRR